MSGVHELSLSHYSDDDTITPYAREQPDKVFTYEKPHGLWVSVDRPDDWVEWNKAEQFRDTNAQRRHRVVLAADADVLVLDTVAAMHDFHDTYATADEYIATTVGYTSRLDLRGIDWRAVAGAHQGVIIAPYHWSLRYDMNWYYGWDCASGCLWDPAAIKEVTPCPAGDPRGVRRVRASTPAGDGDPLPSPACGHLARWAPADRHQGRGRHAAHPGVGRRVRGGGGA